MCLTFSLSVYFHELIPGPLSTRGMLNWRSFSVNTPGVVPGKELSLFLGLTPDSLQC